MFEIIIPVHLLILGITLAIFSPIKKNITEDYKKLFVRNLPIISLLNVTVPVSVIVYMFYLLMFPVNYIDSFNKTKPAIFFVIFTIILFIFLLITLRSELQNVYIVTKNTGFIKLSIILFLYASSAITSMIFITFTNRAFDISKAEEHIVTIEEGKSVSDDTTKSYYLDVTPKVYDVGHLTVSSFVFDEVRVRSKAQKISENSVVMTKEVKMKVFVYKGLFGVRYIGRSMEVLRN